MRTPVCSNPSQTSPSINQSQPGTRFSPEPDTFNMFVSTLYFYHLTPHYHNHPDVSVMAHGWAGVCLQTTVEWEHKCFSCSHISLKAICSLRIKNVFSLRLQWGDHHHWSSRPGVWTISAVIIIISVSAHHVSSSTFSIFLGQNCSYDHTSHCQISPHHTTAHLHQLQYYQVSLWHHHLQTKFYLLSHEWWRLPPKYLVSRRVLNVNCWCKSWWHVCQVLFCFLIVIATLAVKRRVVVWGEYTIILTYTPHSLITHCSGHSCTCLQTIPETLQNSEKLHSCLRLAMLVFWRSFCLV